MQCWNISVFRLCQMLAMPLIVGGARGGAPPKSPGCRGFCLLIDRGGPAVWKKSVTVYIIVVITKIIAMTIYHICMGIFHHYSYVAIIHGLYQRYVSRLAFIIMNQIEHLCMQYTYVQQIIHMC